MTTGERKENDVGDEEPILGCYPLSLVTVKSNTSFYVCNICSPKSICRDIVVLKCCVSNKNNLSYKNLSKTRVKSPHSNIPIFEPWKCKLDINIPHFHSNWQSSVHQLFTAQ